VRKLDTPPAERTEHGVPTRPHLASISRRQTTEPRKQKGSRSIDRKALTFPSFPHTEAACSTRLRSVTHREITAKADGADPQPWACVSARVPCRSPRSCSCSCCCRRTRILRVVVSYLGVHASLLVSLLAPPCVAVCDPRPRVSSHACFQGVSAGVSASSRRWMVGSRALLPVRIQYLFYVDGVTTYS
jgi:hypothetical protein